MDVPLFARLITLRNVHLEEGLYRMANQKMIKRYRKKEAK